MTNSKDQPSYVQMKPKLDKTSKIPLYQQLIQYIRENIIQGNWTAGQKLPPQRSLAAELDINRSTVATAISELVLSGLLESDYGGGTRIADKSWSFFLPDTPKWNKYTDSGAFHQNHNMIQTLNRHLSNQNYIQFGAPNLAPELFPVAIMQSALKKLPEKVSSLNYLEPLGLYELREVISQKLAAKGIQAKPSNILITSGSVQSFHLISVSMLRSGATIFVEKPSYLKSLQVFQSANIQLKGIPMDKEGICPDQMMTFQSSLGKESSLLYTIPNFHNPTGTLMSESRRKELFSFCKTESLPIIEDDAYGELWFDEPPPKPIKSLDQNGLVLYIGTVSMTLAPGFRAGWLVGPETVVARLADVKMQLDYGASSISQWIVYEILKNTAYEDYLSALRKQVKSRRDFMLDLLSKYFSGIAEWEIPKGGFYIWLKMHKAVSKSLFYEAFESGVLFSPGDIYDNTQNNTLCLSYAYANTKQMEEGIRLLRNLMNDE